MRSQDLRRLFRAIVVGVSAPAVAVGWAACSTDDSGQPDARVDAKNDPDAQTKPDVSEGGIVFPDVSLDSYVDWCEAGPPHWIAMDTCFNYLYVPCGLPQGDYFLDDAGTINRCDQICLGYTAYGCVMLSDAAIQILYAAYPDAWAPPPNEPDAAFYTTCDCYNGGRRPAGLAPLSREVQVSAIGSYFARMAHLEAASVPAFGRMRGELESLGAPRSLLARVDRAVRDERRHARVIDRVARRFGARVQPPRVRRFRERSVEAMARENAIEGCVRETFGALVAVWQAEHATDGDVKRTMARIAVDETEHAALSWAVARFFEAKLSPRNRKGIERARSRAIAQLHAELSNDPHPDVVAHAGLPRASDALRLLEDLAAALLR
jgi:hypothetical protein